VNTDISSIKKVEETTAYLASPSEDAIVSKSLEGIITSWNPAAHESIAISLAQ
jgi:hypothetical protein